MSRHRNDDHPAAAARCWRGIAYRLACAALALGTLVLLGLSWQQMRAVPEPTTAGATDREHRTARAPVRAEPAPPGTLIDPLNERRSPHAWLAGLDASLEPMDREPADLDPWPGEGVEHQWRFRRVTGTGVEEVSAWRVEAGSDGIARTLEAVAASYERQIRDRGFEPVAMPAVDRPDEARHAAFTRRGEADEPMRVLTLRLAPESGAIHVLIALRYATRATPR